MWLWEHRNGRWLRVDVIWSMSRSSSLLKLQGRIVKSQLASGSLASFDQGIVETELELDPEQVRFTEAERKSNVVASTELLNLIDHAAVISRSTVPSPADQALAANNLSLAPTHPDRNQLALALLRSEVRLIMTLPNGEMAI